MGDFDGDLHGIIFHPLLNIPTPSISLFQKNSIYIVPQFSLHIHVQFGLPQIAYIHANLVQFPECNVALFTSYIGCDKLHIKVIFALYLNSHINLPWNFAPSLTHLLDLFLPPWIPPLYGCPCKTVMGTLEGPPGLMACPGAARRGGAVCYDMP